MGSVSVLCFLLGSLSDSIAFSLFENMIGRDEKYNSPPKRASDPKNCSDADMRNSLCQVGSLSVLSFASSLDHSHSSPVSTELHCIAHCFCIALHWFALASLSLLSRQHQLHCIAHCIASRCIALGSPSFLSSQH